MSDSSSYTITKPVAITLSAGALAILGLNVALILQNSTLKREMAAPPALLPQVGTRVAQLEGVSLDGSKLRISFGDQGNETLLFVFSTHCGVCNLNWPQWQSIAQSLEARRLVRLVYANIESPLDLGYAKQYRIEGATVFAQLDPRYEVVLNLRVTPLTILLAGSGEVLHVWPGLLDTNDLSELRRTLGLASP